MPQASVGRVVGFSCCLACARSQRRYSNAATIGREQAANSRSCARGFSPSLRRPCSVASCSTPLRE
eukprot:2999641-Alexandrium_andersonii.AAC.1